MSSRPISRDEFLTLIRATISLHKSIIVLRYQVAPLLEKDNPEIVKALDEIDENMNDYMAHIDAVLKAMGLQ